MELRRTTPPVRGPRVPRTVTIRRSHAEDTSAAGRLRPALLSAQLDARSNRPEEHTCVVRNASRSVTPRRLGSTTPVGPSALARRSYAPSTLVLSDVLRIGRDEGEPVGKNNKARRAAKKRKEAQARGPLAHQKPAWTIAWNDDGEPVELDSDPIEFVYYDEPDFQTRCPKCEAVYEIPIHSMRFRADWVAERGEPENVNGVTNGCPNCGYGVETPPRVETAPDGTTLYTTDRQTLLAAGLEEWHSEIMGMTLSKDGVDFQLTMSGGSEQVLVVCDDCGLPFITRIAHQAVISSADAPIELDMEAGPCEHCGGFGKVLSHTISDGNFVTVTASPDFAQSVLATLADDLRSGKLDLGAVSTELRRQGGPYQALADWIDARPVNAVIASTVLSVVASLAVNQVPPIVNQHTDPVQQQRQRPAPGTYTEDQVAEIVEKVLDHYDRTHDLRDKPAKPQKENGG